MNTEELDAISAALADLGFVDLGSKVAIANVDFEFDRVLIGRHANQGLCVVCSSQSEVDGSAERNVSALARALDLAGSRLSITSLVVGASESNNSDLLMWSRVIRLREESLVDSVGTRAALRPLSRLTYTATNELGNQDPLSAVWQTLRTDDASSEMLTALRDVSANGALAVEETYRQWIEQALGSK